MGSRYGGLKQMDPVGPGGETIIDYSVYDALRAGFGRLVFVIRRDIEKDFREIVGSRFEGRIAVDYVFQELDRLPAGFALPPNRKKPWGTGHAIFMAADTINEPFAVINADDFYGADSFQSLAAELNSQNSHYAMTGFVLRNTLSEFGGVARGICRTADGFLERVIEVSGIEKRGQGAAYKNGTQEMHILTGDETVSMNMWGFNPTIFDSLGEQLADFLSLNGQDEKAEFYIPSAVNTLLRGGKKQVKICNTRSSWLGVTYREDRPFVVDGIRALVRRGDYPERLWS